MVLGDGVIGSLIMALGDGVMGSFLMAHNPVNIIAVIWREHTRHLFSPGFLPIPCPF